MRFRDRTDAGERLAGALSAYRAERPAVVGLARGGVVVASAVARGLDAQLFVTVVRKLGHPRQPELGLGAVAEDGVPVWNEEALWRFGLDERATYEVLARERAELTRRLRRYRFALLPEQLGGRTVILVDDGLATGGSARAALAYVARKRPARLVLAVPVGAPDVVGMLRPEVDDLVVLASPRELRAVGEWYDQFEQCDDAQVLDALSDDHGERSSRFN